MFGFRDKLLIHISWIKPWDNTGNSINCFSDVLDFELIAVEKDYYDEGEHAYCMRRSLVKFAKDNQIKPFDEEMFYSEKKFVKKVENQEDDVDL